MEWLKKHADTAMVLGAIFTVFVWMQAEFRDLDRRLTRIETVMIMQKFMPNDLVVSAINQEKH